MEDLSRNRKSASNIKHLGQKPTISENQDDDICAICMGSYENISHPNECFHKYCFGCLEEWTKIKPECPLCLKKITSIIHSIQIDGTSEKYSLPVPQPTNVDQIKNLIDMLFILLLLTFIIASTFFTLLFWYFLHNSVPSTLDLILEQNKVKLFFASVAIIFQIMNLLEVINVLVIIHQLFNLNINILDLELKLKLFVITTMHFFLPLIVTLSLLLLFRGP